MADDFDALVSQPIFEKLGLPATFTNPATYACETLTVIDGRGGIDVGGGDVPVIAPALGVRASDLAAKGISPEEMLEVSITFLGVEYVVRNIRREPLHGCDGEIWLILSEER